MESRLTYTEINRILYDGFHSMTRNSETDQEKFTLLCKVVATNLMKARDEKLEEYHNWAAEHFTLETD